VNESSATVTYTINRGGNQIAPNGLTCSLTGPTTSTSCGTITTAKHTTSGTVTLTGLQSGTYTYNVALLLSDGGTASASASFNVVTSPLTITGPTVIPGAIVGTPFVFIFTANGGMPPYNWAVIRGSLPPGLSLDGSTGHLTGTPTAAGLSIFTVSATDSFGDVTEAIFSCNAVP
jgi:hypothetical protein